MSKKKILLFVIHEWENTDDREKVQKFYEPFLFSLGSSLTRIIFYD